MSKPFKALIAKLPPERQARIQDRTAELSGKMALQELRQALKLTQQQIAATQHLNQAAVSKTRTSVRHVYQHIAPLY